MGENIRLEKPSNYGNDARVSDFAVIRTIGKDGKLVPGSDKVVDIFIRVEVEPKSKAKSANQR